MKPRARYGILIFGIFVFLILAPLVALYTSGFRINFSDGSVTQTGILSATTDPDGATVSINGEVRDTTPASIRFLKPGDYSVKISKHGYFDWQKRLNVRDGVVTWANEDLENLYLLLRDGEQRTITNGAKDILVKGNRLLVLNNNLLSISEAPNFNSWDTSNLPVSVDAIIDTHISDAVLLSGGESVLLASLNNHRITDITQLLEPGSRITALSTTHVVSLEGTEAYLINAATGAKNLIEQNVIGLTNFGNDIYYLQTDGLKTNLLLRGTSGDIPGDARLIADDVPATTESQIFVTPQKRVYIFTNQTLYAINDKPEALATGIGSLCYDTNSASLVFQTASELFILYDDTQRPQLITRYSGTISHPTVLPFLHYAVLMQDTHAVALELDTRDGQNRYVLMETETPRKLYVTLDGTQLLVLDGETIKIRRLKE